MHAQYPPLEQHKKSRSTSQNLEEKEFYLREPDRRQIYPPLDGRLAHPRLEELVDVCHHFGQARTCNWRPDGNFHMIQCIP